jgi:hypothetical protein
MVEIDGLSAFGHSVKRPLEGCLQRGQLSLKVREVTFAKHLTIIY